MKKNLLQWPPGLDTNGLPTGWEHFPPRSEVSPLCTLTEIVNQSGKGALEIWGNHLKNCFGGWRTVVKDIESEHYYAFEAYCKAENVESLWENISVFYRWQGDFGPEVTPDCGFQSEKTKNGWVRFFKIVQAPRGADKVQLELALKWSGNGRIWWDNIRFFEVPKPDSRPLKICTTFMLPQGISSQENVNEFARLIDRAAEKKPDIILLTETITLYHLNNTYQDVAEEIPNGPTSRIMSDKAREYSIYLIYCINERVGDVIYNSSVLLNRDGEIIGKYRKVHIPQEELYGGVSPGNEFPVFETEFGKIGMLVCIDTAFPEAAKALALKGAEIIFAPTWGANPVGLQARAIDNGLYMVNAGFDVPSMIINPLGEVLAQADTEQGDGLAFAKIDLAHNFRQPWLGNWSDMVQVMRRENPYRNNIGSE